MPSLSGFHSRMAWAVVAVIYANDLLDWLIDDWGLPTFSMVFEKQKKNGKIVVGLRNETTTHLNKWMRSYVGVRYR